MGAGVGIVLEFVVLGVCEMDPAVSIVMGGDLFLVGDEVMPLEAIAGQSGAGDGELDAEIHLSILLLSVGVLGIPADPDLGVEVRGELGTAEVEGVVGL